MKKIISAAEKLGKKIRITAVSLVSAAGLVIISDIIFQWSYTLDPVIVVGAGKVAAGIAVACAVAALGYYLLRTLYIRLKKSSVIISPAADAFIRDLTAVFRHLHTTFGASAISLLIIHFYIIFFVAYGREINKMTISGMGAFILLSVLGMLGYILLKNLQNKKIRITHRSAAFLMVVAFFVHKVFIFFRV